MSLLGRWACCAGRLGRCGCSRGVADPRAGLWRRLRGRRPLKDYVRLSGCLGALEADDDIWVWRRAGGGREARQARSGGVGHLPKVQRRCLPDSPDGGRRRTNSSGFDRPDIHFAVKEACWGWRRRARLASRRSKGLSGNHLDGGRVRSGACNEFVRRLRLGGLLPQSEER